MASKQEPLSVTHPELATQADGWDPTTLSAGSGKKVAWKCKHGHKWQSIVANRSKGMGCPVCSGRVANSGVNDLATTNPELAAQANGWDPTTVLPFSHSSVSWLCRLGHAWKTSVANRSKGDGCPICSGHQVLVGFNDLATTNPQLAAQANGWDPTTVVANSNKKMDWKCDFGHEWNAWIGNRSKGSGCPICSGHQVLVGFNDLATTNPELAAQADGWDPTDYSRGSDKRVMWKCGVGHQWTASLGERSSGNGCPTCANKKILVGFNDLATTNPELAAQADGWDPTTVVSYSNKKVGWICEFNHQWHAAVGSRTSGQGCPICSGHRVLQGYNDLATTNPELAAQADGWDPSTLSAFSNKKVKWICEFNHQWHAVVGSRTRGRGCPICSGHRVLQGYNDLATTNPELAAQADGWDPTTVMSQTHKKVDWVCTIGHKWKATVKNRFRSTGCPICSNKQLLIGFNDLATTNPELAAQADGWDPSTIFANTNQTLSWRCLENHTWRASANNRSQGKDCPTCAKYGFNPGKDGWLYFIENDALEMFQIGISNMPENRLRKHSLTGWNVVEVRGPMDGFLTRSLEFAALKSLAKRGAVLGHKADIEKFDGYSEAWTKESLFVTSFKQLLDWIYEDDQSTFHLQK